MTKIVEFSEGEEGSFHAVRNGSGATTRIVAAVLQGSVRLCGQAKEVG